MLGVVKEAYKNIKREPSENTLKTCVYIMDRNIIWGDALTESLWVTYIQGKSILYIKN